MAKVKTKAARPAAKKLPAALTERAKALKAGARERLRARGLAAIDRVKEKLGDVAANVLDLGAALVELTAPGVAEAAGYADFEDACRRALKVHPATARRWMALATNLRRQFVLTVGLDRARALMELADATPADDTAEDLLAATLTLPSGEKLVVKDATSDELDAAARAFRQARPEEGKGSRRGFTTTPAERKAFGAIERRLRKAPKEARAAARLVAQRDEGGAKVVLEARLAAWAELLATLGGG